MPQNPSQAIVFQWRLTAGQCRRIEGSAKGSIAASATHQRMKVSARGETVPTNALPITQLSDQKSEHSVRSRYGEASPDETGTFS